MENWILTVGCPPELFMECQKEWLNYNILLRVVRTIPEAIEEIIKNDYLLLSICAKTQEYLPFLRVIRSIKPLPILISPLKYDVSEKIKAIESGADSYIEIPQTIEECVASGWALVRRYVELDCKQQGRINIITNKDIFVCLDYRKVFVRSIEVSLTKTEFDILQLLMSHKQRVFTYEQIFCHVWGDEYYDSANSILWNHIKRLRQKLKIEPDIPDYIKCVHDVGYTFDPQNESHQIIGKK